MPNMYQNYPGSFNVPRNQAYRYGYRGNNGPSSMNASWNAPHSQQTRGSRGVPLSIPKGGGLSQLLGFKSVAGEASKFNISKLLTSAESIVTTVNQVIPIYQQLKPIYDNSKTLRKAVGSFISGKKKGKTEVIDDPEIVNPPKKETHSFQEKNEHAAEAAKPSSSTINHQAAPNKPFF